MRINLYLKTGKGFEGEKSFNEDFNSIEEFTNFCLSKVNKTKEIIGTDYIISMMVIVPELYIYFNYREAGGIKQYNFYSDAWHQSDFRIFSGALKLPKEYAKLYFLPEFRSYLKKFQKAVDNGSEDIYLKLIGNLTKKYGVPNNDGDIQLFTSSVGGLHTSSIRKIWLTKALSDIDDNLMLMVDSEDWDDFQEDFSASDITLNDTNLILNSQEEDELKFDAMSVAISFLLSVLE